MSCVQTQVEKVDLDQVRKASEQFIAAVKSNDLEKIAESYAEDAINLRPNGEVIRGKQAIKEAWMIAKIHNFELILEEIELDGYGDLAYQANTATFNWQKEGLDTMFTELEKNVLIWKKQTDGSWKIKVDIYNRDIPRQE